jgi:protein-S-isoprenylcysteine O-methyltransferase Ste14
MSGPAVPIDREPTVREIFATLRRKELYGNLAVHLFILIPAAVVLAFLGRVLDRNWGWAPLPGPPWNVALAVLCFGAGGFLVWYAYGYLHLKGGGSPGAHMGYTQRLVTTGIYSWVRHPSVIGKLIGVVGLGLLMRTPGFLLVIVPFLLLYSYATNILIQERNCLRNLGEGYARYRREVPMFVPRWERIARWSRERRGQ